MMSRTRQPLPSDVSAGETAGPAAYWMILLFVFCAWILFSDLGGAALFEPDEGRNAEVAREILLLRDSVTPHYDFIPRLDKPVLFFDLVALSYRLFGVSEWSARLPSALAALGCLSLTYLLARSLFGSWTGLWSALILLTNVEFFALSRIVILDMVLCLFLTVALCCFFFGHRETDRKKARLKFALMYIAVGAATLVKGPIGFLLPFAVIGCYMLLAKQRPLLGQFEVFLGISLFILTAFPWYALIEYRHPGFLQHFFWIENFARFTTTEFNRTGSWYYFLGVLSIGFLPWSGLLPYTLASLRHRPTTEKTRFLAIWIAIPLLFFSVSSSKLPHYILPIYPPLAIIVGAAIAELPANYSKKTCWSRALPSLFFLLVSLLFSMMVVWPTLLPLRLQVYVTAAFAKPPVGLVLVVLIALMLALVAARRGIWKNQVFLYPATCLGFTLFILYGEPIVASVALHRTSKQLAERALSFIRESDQLFLFGGYPSSLPFYLNVQRPIGVVWSGKNSKVLGSDYVAKARPEPAAGYGQILFTYDEFAALWKTANGRFVVFVDGDAVDRFNDLIDGQPKILMEIGSTLVVENRAAVY